MSKFFRPQVLSELHSFMGLFYKNNRQSPQLTNLWNIHLQYATIFSHILIDAEVCDLFLEQIYQIKINNVLEKVSLWP